MCTFYMKEEIGEKEITDDDDFVMIERNGQILSGGFHVNSLLLKHKQSPMRTLNQRFSGGSGTDEGNVSDLFKDLAVPAGIFYEPSKSGGTAHNNDETDAEEINEDIYDKLVKLASIEEKSKENKKKFSRKNVPNKKKYTKKLVAKK